MSKLFRNSPVNVIPTKLGFFQCSLAWNEKFSLPFSAQGESLSQKKNEMEKAEASSATLGSCILFKNSFVVMLRFLFDSHVALSILFSVRRRRIDLLSSELGIKTDSYCRLENSSKDRFHSKDASWNWIKWNKNRLLSSRSHVGKIQSSPESR